MMTQVVPIFSGGGTRLTAHIGVLKALRELNIDFEQAVGVSGGSIILSLYCSGRSLDDILQLAINTDFKRFRGFSIIRLLREGGLSSGDAFEKWMDNELSGITFSSMPKALSIMATDVNGGGPVIFDKHNTPNMKVSEAVRYSMSIPLMFSFKPYKKHLLVDGAILSEDALFRDWSSQGTPNFCFRLKSEQTQSVKKKRSLVQLPEYVMMLIRTFMTAISREYVHANNWHNTVVIDTGSISPVDFNLTSNQKMELYDVGYDTVMTFLPQKLQECRQDNK